MLQTVICSLCNNSRSRSRSLEAYASFHGVCFVDCTVGLMSRETKGPQNHSSSEWLFQNKSPLNNQKSWSVARRRCCLEALQKIHLGFFCLVFFRRVCDLVLFAGFFFFNLSLRYALCLCRLAFFHLTSSFFFFFPLPRCLPAATLRLDFPMHTPRLRTHSGVKLLTRDNMALPVNRGRCANT